MLDGSERTNSQPTLVATDQVQVNGRIGFDNSPYALYADQPEVVVKALSSSQPEESSLRARIDKSYKASRPSFFDHIMGEDDGMGGPVYPTSKVGYAAVFPNELSTVIFACQRMADGRGFRNKLRTRRAREEALKIADRLGSKAAQDFRASIVS